MRISEMGMSDFALVEVKTTNDCQPTPHCKLHGAMNKVSVFKDGGGYWRCVSFVTRNNDNGCRAGCSEVRG